MTARTLVVGGTGPTGPSLVNHLIQAGHEVTIFHTGTHEAEFIADVEHLHGDPRDPDSIADALGDREWEIAICMYGRLRALATSLAGRVSRLVGITGQPVYRGAARPTPDGTIALPVPEFAPRQSDRSGYTGRVAVGEDQLFEQHGRGDFEAVIVRYPGIFGPNATINHEWAVVKRVLDQRPFMLMPENGISYFQRGYVENAGWLVFLAATRPEAAGQAFNAGDERVISARRVAEIIVDELDSPMELVGVPAAYCPPGCYPLAQKAPLILDMSKPRNLLGYRDRVDLEEATRATARWYAEHPEPDDLNDRGGAGRFDYPAEDRVLAAWQSADQELQSLLAPPDA